MEGEFVNILTKGVFTKYGNTRNMVVFMEFVDKTLYETPKKTKQNDTTHLKIEG